MNICLEDMEIDPVHAIDVQNPPDIDTSQDTTQDEADLEVRPNNLSITTDNGSISTGKLLTLLQFIQFRPDLNM